MAKKWDIFNQAGLYTFSSVASRFFSLMLVPVYTYAMGTGGGEYGILTNYYAFGSLLMVILSMGMESTFMRYANKPGVNAATVYSTALASIWTLTFLFLLCVFPLSDEISRILGYPLHAKETRLMAGVIALDTLAILPFCNLRYRGEARKYALWRVFYGAINAIGTFYVLIVCPFFAEMDAAAMAAGEECWIANATRWLWDFWEPGNSLIYAIFCNLFASTVTLLALIDDWKPFGLFRTSNDQFVKCDKQFDWKLFCTMMSFAIPILCSNLLKIGITYVDRILYPWLVPGDEGLQQLSIYGASFRIAMIMALTTQILRDVLEPVIFRSANDKRRLMETSRSVAKGYYLSCIVIFLFMMAWMDVIKQFMLLDTNYWEGIRVVPLLMCAEMGMGVEFYLSFWYKVEDKPIYGTVFTLIALVSIIAIMWIFVPDYGYMACGWALVAGSWLRASLTYIFGFWKSEYKFENRSNWLYFLLGIAVLWLMDYLPTRIDGYSLLIKNTCATCFTLFALWQAGFFRWFIQKTRAKNDVLENKKDA